jgi:glycosyltransferase involved in cell wall biosynthesis
MRPEITVIVPYHNEKNSIEYTLERVGEQTLPATAAVFVNSSSSDDTSVVVDRWIRKNQQRFSTQFLNVFEHTDNPASSKNAGIRHASTEWLAFMDCGQNFDKTWLEQQYRCVQDRHLDVVSGVVYTVGENWVDRCAIAQTYGYRRNRPCVPTTLAKKSVFEKTGLFLEGRRAGYDAAWLRRLGKLGIARGVNETVKITYIGFNFSPSLAHLYRKSVLYAKPSVALEGYWMPYAYAVSPFLFALIAVASAKAAGAALLFYFLARTFLVPVAKSRGIVYFKEHTWEALLGLGVVGFVMDLGKTVGTWQGIRYYYFSKSRAAGC